jgi:hypothetical protein
VAGIDQGTASGFRRTTPGSTEAGSAQSYKVHAVHGFTYQPSSARLQGPSRASSGSLAPRSSRRVPARRGRQKAVSPVALKPSQARGGMALQESSWWSLGCGGYAYRSPHQLAAPLGGQDLRGTDEYTNTRKEYASSGGSGGPVCPSAGALPKPPRGAGGDFTTEGINLQPWRCPF